MLLLLVLLLSLRPKMEWGSKSNAATTTNRQRGPEKTEGMKTITQRAGQTYQPPKLAYWLLEMPRRSVAHSFRQKDTGGAVATRKPLTSQRDTP